MNNINKMYGIHILNDVDDNIDTIKEMLLKYTQLKCNIFQIFVDINQKKSYKYTELNKFSRQIGIKLVVHISYYINIAQKWDSNSWWIKHVIEEIKIANIIGAIAVVIHLGKKLEMEKYMAIMNMYTSLLYIHNETQKSKVKILFETSSGQGSEMLYNLDELAEFYSKFKNNKNKLIIDRFGICIDTCHIFVSGIDISDKKKTLKYIEEFDKKIGFSNVKLIHLNDSQNEYNTKIDRHANINRGYIGLDGLKPIIQLAFKIKIPIILETPSEYIKEDIKFVSKITH